MNSLELIETNLREGQIRLIFFLQDSPFELRSIVDFLNRQMERTEVLIVEARQYEQKDLRVVVPVLFSYTDQARRVKKAVRVVKEQEASFNPVAKDIWNKSFISVMSGGVVYLNAPWLRGNERIERLRDEFLKLVQSEMGVELPEDAIARWPEMKIVHWDPKVDDFIAIIESLVERYGRSDQREANGGNQ